MENITEKNFDPDLKIVDAVGSIRSNRMWLISSIVIIVVGGYFFWLTFGKWWQNGGFWLFVAWFFCFVFAFFMLFILADTLLSIQKRRKLHQFGVEKEALIVGRECVESNESEVYYIYYQFDPGFVVRLLDDTHNRAYYKCRLGDSISVRVLLEDPETSGAGF